MSADLVKELQLSADVVPQHRPQTNHRRKDSKEARIIIRWSCGKLGQYSEESIFSIELKAHFKMMFGCVYPSTFQIDRRVLSLKNHYTSRKAKSTDTLNQPLSDTATDVLFQGIEDVTLLRVKKLPPAEKNSQTIVADLETYLKFIYASYSSIDRFLDSTSIVDSSSSCELGRIEESLSGVEISSLRDSSEPDTESRPRTESPATSVSEGSYYPLGSINHKLQQQRSPWVMKSWARQRIEDGPWTPRTIRIQHERSTDSFRRCHNLTPQQESALAAAKAAALKETSEYWIWDEGVKQYKHYDEGCSEPVWYNPPQAVVK